MIQSAQLFGHYPNLIGLMTNLAFTKNSFSPLP